MPAPGLTTGLPVPGGLVPAAPSCEVRGWVVFGPGYHKGRLYTAADCERLAANFARLSAGAESGPGLRVKASYEPPLVPGAKLGHDKAQRLAQSLGVLSAGTPTACRLTPAGEVEIDVAGVPLWLGAEINAGRVNDGSIEIADDVPDPADPAKTIPGPVLTGVSFLGEEQPAVKGYPPPRATMPDGTEPPAEAPKPPWADPDFLARLTSAPDDGASTGPGPRSHADLFGRRVAVRTYRFSESTPLATPTGSPAVRDQLNQQLSAMGLDPAAPHWAGLSDDELKAALADMCGQQFSAAMKKKFADGNGGATPAPPPVPADPNAPALDPKVMAAVRQCMADPKVMAAVRQCMADPNAPALDPKVMAAVRQCMAEVVDPLTKRMGAVEKFAEEMQKDKPALDDAKAFGADYKARLAADFTTRVEAVLTETARTYPPADKGAFLAQGLATSDRTQFSDGPHKGKTSFDVWAAGMRARRPHPLFAETPDPVADGDPAADPFVQRAMQHLPGMRKADYPVAAAAK